MNHQQICLFLSFIFTFLWTQFPRVHSQDITFVEEPLDNYFIAKRRKAVITCTVRNAVDVSFTCGGTKVPPTSVELDDTVLDVIKATITVTYADIKNYKDGVYWCECNAISFNGDVAATSRRADISHASLKYKFKKHPTSKEVNQGDTLELECEPPIGFPTPEIIWKKNNRRLDFDSDGRFEITMDGNLIIESVRTSDAATYQCIAKNPAGKRNSKPADVQVVELAESQEPKEVVEESNESKPRPPRESPEPAFSAEPKAQYYIKSGEAIDIDCGVTAADIITYRCNGARMDRKRQTTKRGQDASGVKILQSQLKVVYSDVADYKKRHGQDKDFQCRCVGWYQKKEAWMTILSSNKFGMIKLAFLESTFQKEPKNDIVGLNVEATLECEPPKGQPSPWVYWFKDDAKIDPRSDTHFRVTREGHLVIQSTELSDTGRYKCVAENTVKKVQSKVVEFRVSADAPPPTDPPTTTQAVQNIPEKIPEGSFFLQDLAEKTVIGDDGVAKLMCVSLGATMLSIDCNGRRLGPDDYNLKRESHQSTGKNMLTITTEVGAGDVAESPDGYFCQCIAWSYSETTQDWEQRSGNKGYVMELKRVYIAEEFGYPPKDTEVSFEESAEIACEPPKGQPLPKVFWKKDGVKIDTMANSNYVVLPSGALVIEFAQASDAGEFICGAENEAGTRESAPITLSVLGIPTKPPMVEKSTSTMRTTTEDFDYDNIQPFYVTQPAEKNYIIDDGAVELRCQIIEVKHLFFVCNGKVVKKSTRSGTVARIDEVDVRENSLLITAYALDNYSGEAPYSCLCRAIGDNDEDGNPMIYDSMSGTIERAYLNPDFVKVPENTETMAGSDVTLMCVPPEGNPKANVTWIKDGFQLSSDNVNDDGSLTLRNVKDTDAGDYVCSAENLAKKRTSPSAKLTVKGGEPMGVTDGPIPEPESTTPTGMQPDGTAEPTQLINTPMGVPYISKDLHSVYYLVRNKPVTILCEAVYSSRMTFTCGGVELREDNFQVVGSVKTMETEMGMEQVNVVTGTATITKQDVELYGGDSMYQCVCKAYYEGEDKAEQFVSSQNGYVDFAYLKKKFSRGPESQSVSEGTFLSLNCQPPQGFPFPEVSWMKNGQPIPSGSVPGALVFESLTSEDAGEYTCVATNVAAKRMSQPAYIEVIAMPKPDTTEGTMSETTMEDKDFEVEEMTSVPLTTDSVDDSSTTNKTSYAETTDKSTSESESSSVSNTDTSYDTTDGTMEKRPTDTTTDMHYPTDQDYIVSSTVVGQQDVETTPEQNYEPSTMMTNEIEKSSGIPMITPDKTVTPVMEFSEFTTMSKEMGDDTTYMPHSTGGDRVPIKGVTMVDERVTCVRKMETCHMLSERDGGCSQEFAECMREFIEGCDGVISAEIVKQSRDNYEMIQSHCRAQGSQCRGLEQCRNIYDESQGQQQNNGHGLSMNLFCGNIYQFIDCADRGLESCGVDMVTPGESNKASAGLGQISEWFSSYCHKLMFENSPLNTCEAMSSCSLPVAVPAADNSTYWCGLVDHLLGCTISAAKDCEFEEQLGGDIQMLYQMMSDSSCPVPASMFTPKPVEPTPVPGTDEDGKSDASKGDDGNNGAGSAGVSILFMTLIQLALTLFLSRR